MAFERRKDVDAVAGLMVIWIICGHLSMIVPQSIEMPRWFFYSMPWFYFKAGMMWKKSDFSVSFHKGIRKFLPPWLLYGLLGLAVSTICLIVERQFSILAWGKSIAGEMLFSGTISGNGPLWFLTSLMLVQCLSAYVLSKKDYPCLLAIISLLCGYILSIISIPLTIPTYINSMFGGLFFFNMGIWLKEEQYNLRLAIPSVSLLAAFYVYVSLGYSGFAFVIRTNEAVNCNYLIGAICALIGCIAIDNIFKWLQPFLRFCILQYVGRNAMVFYALHWVILTLCVRLVAIDMLHIQDTACLIWIGVISCCVLLPTYALGRKYVKTRK